jgi:hypothetical protein
LRTDAFDVVPVSGCQDVASCGLGGRGVLVVDVGFGVQAEARMMVFVVAPGEERLAVRSGGSIEVGRGIRAGTSGS